MFTLDICIDVMLLFVWLFRLIYNISVCSEYPPSALARTVCLESYRPMINGGVHDALFSTQALSLFIYAHAHDANDIRIQLAQINLPNKTPAR